MSAQCRIHGKVINPDGSVASGRVSIYLRARSMTYAEKMVFDRPVAQAPIAPDGSVDFFLEPNHNLPLVDSFYEVHVHTKKTSWTEKWIVPDVPEKDFGSFSGSEVAPWYYIQQIDHEADIHNPHLTTIEEVLRAQPDYRIPLDRIDTESFTSPGTPNVTIPSYFFEVITEGEVLFVLPYPFDPTDPDSIIVNLNGLEQKEGVANDFRIIDSYTIEFNRPLHTEELIEIKILKSV